VSGVLNGPVFKQEEEALRWTNPSSKEFHCKLQRDLYNGRSKIAEKFEILYSNKVTNIAT
jgi:hypothetical protein